MEEEMELEQEQMRKPKISFFASDGKGRISRSLPNGQIVDTDPWGRALRQQQQADNGAMYEQMYKDQKSSFDEMSQVMQTAQRENAKKQIALANDIGAAMRIANGGVLPEPVRNLINRKHGFDGRTTGILPSSGFTEGGTFDLIIGNGVDQNGNLMTSRQSFDPLSQYMMMGTNRAAFNDDDRQRMRDKLLKEYGYSQNELNDIDAGFQQMALNSGNGGGSGVETAKIYAEQRAKELEFKQQKQAEDAAFRQQKHEEQMGLARDKFMRDVNKDANKAAQDFFSSLSDEDKKSVSEDYKNFLIEMHGKYGNKAPIKPGDNNGVEPSKYGTAQKDGEYWVRTTKDGRKFRIKNGDDPNVRSNWSQF